MPAKKRGRPAKKATAAAAPAATTKAAKGKRGRPKLPGVAKGTIKVLSTSIASVQKRIAALQKVVDKIQSN